MNPQQQNELAFWRAEVQRLGLSEFLKVREQDLHRYWFAERLLSETGRGIDYGCGLVSVFEFAQLDVVAVDPLMSEYWKILKPHIPLPGVSGKVWYFDERWPKPDAESCDWAYCCNVIDHTPDPQTIIDDLLRLLKPGGRLYFEVHFDDVLGAAYHHMLWRLPTVRKYLAPFTLIEERVVRDPVHPQSHYEAVYVRP